MGYLLSALVNLIVDLLATIFDWFGTAVVSMLCMDVGYSGSFFEITFPIATDFLRVFGVMGFGLLALNLLWQLFKVIATPDSSAEPPISLFFRTLLAGMCMFMAPRLIRIGESFFALFYNYFLGTDTSVWASEGVFLSLRNGIVGGIATAAEAATFAAGSAAAGTVIASGTVAGEELLNSAASGGTQLVYTSLPGMFFTLILLLVLGYNYMLYLIEVVERYVLLNVLYYTSPLAFSMAGSKSTSNIFSSWVKMVLSQMFLMVCNVFFMRLFISGMGQYIEAMKDLQDPSSGEAAAASTSATAETIVWVLVLYGILYIGMRVDSYLSTLGLSAAQTGRGMGAAIMLNAAAVRSTLAAGAALGKGGTNLGKNAVSKYRDTHQEAKMDPVTKGFNKDTVDAFAKGNLNKESMSRMKGFAFKQAMLNNIDGLPANMLKDMVSADGTMGNGVFKMSSRPNANGEKNEIIATPLRNVDPKDLRDKHGMVGKVGGEDYFFQAKGPDAQKILTSGEDVSKLRAAGYKPVMDETGNAVPGKWERVTGGKNGEPIKTEVLSNAALYSAPSATLYDITKDGEFGAAQFWHNESAPIAWKDSNNTLNPDQVYYGDKGKLENELKWQNDIQSGGFSAAAMEAEGSIPSYEPKLEAVKVDAAQYQPFSDSAFASVDASATEDLTARCSNFGVMFPSSRDQVDDAKAIAVEGDNTNGYTGNFEVLGQDGQRYLYFDTVRYENNPQLVDEADINHTFSSTGVLYGVVPIEGRDVSQLIQERSGKADLAKAAPAKLMEIVEPVDLNQNQVANVLIGAFQRKGKRNDVSDAQK